MYTGVDSKGPVYGTKVGDFALPKDFEIGATDDDYLLTFINLSTGGTFHGLIDELLFFERPFTQLELSKRFVFEDAKSVPASPPPN